MVVNNKYRNIRKEYKGAIYHSIKEVNFAQELDLRLMAKDIKDWKRQILIPLMFKGEKLCKYYIDFVIIHNDNSIEYVEIKGYKTALWKLKWKILTIMLKNNKIKLTIL